MTPKAERTRERIIEAAIRLFATRGYAETTMSDIAQEAGVATGLAYRYFRRKEELTLALYEQLSEAVAARVGELPTGGFAARWAALLRLRYAVVQPHRRTLLALVQAAMDPDGELGVLSPATASLRARWHALHRAVVEGANDAPPVDPDTLARLLYGLDLLLVLVWTQDRSTDGRNTLAAVDAVAGLLTTIAPFLAFPGAGASLARLDALFRSFATHQEISS